MDCLAVMRIRSIQYSPIHSLLIEERPAGNVSKTKSIPPMQRFGLCVGHISTGVRHRLFQMLLATIDKTNLSHLDAVGN